MSGAKTDAVNRSASYAVGWRKVGVRAVATLRTAPARSVQNEPIAGLGVCSGARSPISSRKPGSFARFHLVG